MNPPISSRSSIDPNQQIPIFVSHKETTLMGRLFKWLGLNDDSTAAKGFIIALSIFTVLPGIVFGIDHLINAKNRNDELAEFEEIYIDTIYIGSIRPRDKKDTLQGIDKVIVDLFAKYLNNEGKLDKFDFISDLEEMRKNDQLKSEDLNNIKLIVTDLYPEIISNKQLELIGVPPHLQSIRSNKTLNSLEDKPNENPYQNCDNAFQTFLDSNNNFKTFNKEHPIYIGILKSGYPPVFSIEKYGDYCKNFINSGSTFGLEKMDKEYIILELIRILMNEDDHFLKNIVAMKEAKKFLLNWVKNNNIILIDRDSFDTVIKKLDEEIDKDSKQ